MTHEPFQFEDYSGDVGGADVHLPPLPQGVSEADLLDFVEGRLFGKGAGERLARIHAALHTSPELARLVRGMSVDRAALNVVTKEFSIAEPPRELVGKALDRAHRELAAEVAAAGTRWVLDRGIREPETDTIPVSKVQPAHADSIFTRLFSGARVRRLALAASLLLAAGAGVWGMIALGSAIWPAAPSHNLADNTLPTPNTTDQPSMAVNSADITLPVNTLVNPALEQAGAVITLAADSPLVKKIEPAQTLALAEQGRLVLKVWALPGESYRAALRCDELAGKQLKRTNSAAIWGVGYDDPAELPAALAALATPTFHVDPASHLPAAGGGGAAQPTFAGTDHSNGTSSPITHAQAVSGPAWGVRRVYLVEVEATPAALAAFLAQMEKAQGDSDDPASAMPEVLGVNYVESAAAISTLSPANGHAFAGEAGRVAPPRTSAADRLFWWNAPAERWTRRVVVPVVIESVE